MSRETSERRTQNPDAVRIIESEGAEWRLDAASQALWWSPELYTMFGVTAEIFEPSPEIVGSMLEEGSADLWNRQMEAWRSGPAPFAATYRVVRPDGERRILEALGWTYEDEDGSTQLAGTCRDVTTALLTEDRIVRQQATILRASGDGICGLDIRGRIVFSNAALLTLLRREGQQVEGLGLHDLVHRDPDGRERHPASECPFHTCSGDPARGIDTGFSRADGTWIEVAFVCVPSEIGEVPGRVLSLRDVTARRAAARLLRTSLQQVRSLNAQRGALLNALADAEERERLRLAAEIHDDTIQALGAVALRLSHAGEQASTDEARDVLAEQEIEVRAVAERLRRIMFELMPPVTGTDLRSATEAYCRALFAGSSIRYEIVGGVAQLTPERYLLAYRLMQEALRNALKHSRGTEVRVSMQTTGEEAVFRVADDGVGIGPGEVATTHAGLRIVRQRAEAGGATARFGSGLNGRGSSIEVRMALDWGMSA